MFFPVQIDFWLSLWSKITLKKKEYNSYKSNKKIPRIF